VTHDLGVVAEMCDTVVVMYGGQVAEYGPIDVVYNKAQHPYTQRLLEAFPDLNRPADQLISIPGYPPRLNELPPGCRFEPRCHKKIEQCALVAPKLIDVTKEDKGGTLRVKDEGSSSRPHPSSFRHLAACHLLFGSEVND